MQHLSDDAVVKIFVAVLGGGVINTAVLAWLGMSIVRLISRVDRLEIHVQYLREWIEGPTSDAPYRLPGFRNMGKVKQ